MYFAAHRRHAVMTALPAARARAARATRARAPGRADRRQQPAARYISICV
jgi:hypothetical protein